MHLFQEEDQAGTRLKSKIIGFLYSKLEYLRAKCSVQVLTCSGLCLKEYPRKDISSEFAKYYIEERWEISN